MLVVPFQINIILKEDFYVNYVPRYLQMEMSITRIGAVISVKAVAADINLISAKKPSLPTEFGWQ